jgi:hypothetical protein
MSRGSRLVYLTLLSVSLLFAWFSIHQLRATPSNSWSRLWLVGIAMLGLAWMITKAPQFLGVIDANSPQNRFARYLSPLIRGIEKQPALYGAVLAGSCAIFFAPYPAWQPWPVLVVWMVGIGMLLADSVSLDRRNVDSGFILRGLAWARAARWELLGVLVLTVVALLLRSVALNAIPHNVHGDEGEMGLVARSVVQGQLRNPFATAFLTHSTLWFFIQALSLRIFGDSISGLRMLSALLGTLAVPALYIFVRPLYGRAVAIMATALLAVYHFHLHYSRIGLNNIADPTMMILTLAAFFYGYDKRSWLGFALAGVFMGLAQYFYFSARLIPIVVLALLGYLLLKDRRQLLELRGQIGLMTVGFILSGGPLFRYYLMHPDTFAGRVMEHGLLQNANFVKLQVNGQSLFAALTNHAYNTFGYFIALDEHSPFYDAGIPLLDHGMDVLFILSLVLLLLNWQKIEYMVLLLWVGGTALFGGFLLWDYPQSPRYLIAAPALCVLMALALAKIGSLLSQVVALPEWLSRGIIAVVVLGLMFWNVYFYFGLYTPRNTYASAQAVTEIANYLRPQAGDRYVYMFTSPYFYLQHGTIKFVGKNPRGTDIVDPITSIAAIPDPPSGLRPLFIFVPDRLSELEIVKQRYPNGQLQEYRIQPGNDRTIMYIYEPRK